MRRIVFITFFLCILVLALAYAVKSSTIVGDLVGITGDEAQSPQWKSVSTALLSHGTVAVEYNGTIPEKEHADDASVMDYDAEEPTSAAAMQEAHGVIVKVRSACVSSSSDPTKIYSASVQENIEGIVRTALPKVFDAPPVIEPIFSPPTPPSSGAIGPLGASLLSAVAPTTLDRAASTEAGLNRIVHIDLQTPDSTQAALDVLRPNPCIEYAVPNAIMKVTNDPNDSFFSASNSWGQGYDDLWGLKKIETQDAWSLGAEGEGIVVAVIDTGVDISHPDLQGNIWTNPHELPNGIDDDNNGYIDDIHGWNFAYDHKSVSDDHGHGTHVAGTIAAVANNGIGIAGIAPKVKIMAVKGLSSDGSGSLDKLASGVQYAARNGAKVLNNSWGSEIGQNPLLDDVFAYAEQLGAISIVAAGNSDIDASRFSPANVDTVITVAASTPEDTRAFFSNYGYTVDVAAPGGDNFMGDEKYNILSTMPDSVTLATAKPTLKVANGYWRLAGTSMAAPHVAGTVALLLSKRPDLTRMQVQGILQATADPFSSEPTKPINGGRINAHKAVAFQGLPPLAELLVPSVLSGTINFRGTAMGDNFASYDIEMGKEGTWTTVSHGTNAVKDGILGTWDSWNKDDGVYQFRLTVRTSDGIEITARKYARIRNVAIRWPFMNDTYRLGDTISIVGSVRGAIDHFTVEYGKGWNANEWESNGITLTGNGHEEIFESNLIASWDSSSITDGGLYSLRLRVVRPDGTEVIELLPHIMLDPMIRKGWPQHAFAHFLLGGRYEARASDLDGDGVQEIVLFNLGRWIQTLEEPLEPSTISVLRPDGSLMWQRSIAHETDVWAPTPMTPLILDFDGDGTKEIAVSREGNCTNSLNKPCKIFAFRHDGTDVPGWPKMFDTNTVGVVLTMYAVDIDRDGAMEILTKSNQGQITVIDARGTIRRQFTLPAWTCSYVHYADWNQSLAIAELDGDPEPELVLHGDCNRITAVNLDGSTVAGWPFQPTGLPTYMSPVAVDIDNDGLDEIAVGVKRPLANEKAMVQLFLLDAHASPIVGWPVDLFEIYKETPDSYVTPAVGDVTGDGVPEIFIPGDRTTEAGCKIYGLHVDGNSLPGWPAVTAPNYPCEDFIGFFQTSVAIADVNGDRKNDVIFGGNGDNYYAIKYGDAQRNGGVRAWNGDGSPIDLNGALPGNALLAGSTCMGICVVSPRDVPIVTDLDGNGTTEILFAEWQPQAYARGFKGWNALTIWNLPSPYHAPSAPWPTRYHDAELTSRYTVPATCSGEQCDDDNNPGWSDGQIFTFFDTDGDGTASTREARKGLSKIIMKVFAKDLTFDIDGDGTVARSDIRAATDFIRGKL